jgi:hypothetical protein
MEVTKNIMQHRMSAQEQAPFVCINCGIINYPQVLGQEGNQNEGQEIINI